MANRAWRNELNNRNYMYGSGYGAPISYNQNVYDDRRNFSNRGGYQEDVKWRGKRTFDNNDVSPKKVVRENNAPSFRRNYVAPAVAAPVVAKKPVAKYSVRPPKVTFDLKEGSIPVLRSRYSRLYIPSDFFHTDFRWQDVFPLYTPLALGNKTTFQMFHRDVEPLTPFVNDRLDPADANYTYSAKVMLLESTDMSGLIKNVCDAGNSDKKNLLKSLNFLVGTKGKNEPLAIGGPWSPSLDGPNPDEDPQVLINTAIRTCKELTAIDLTACKEWYRFVEIHYYRPADRQGLNISTDNDENRTETENNFRVETVVIFIPSVWDCMPDEDNWEDLKTRYGMALEAILSPPLPEPAVEIVDLEDKKDVAEESDAAAAVNEAEKEITEEKVKVDGDEPKEVEKMEDSVAPLVPEVKAVEPIINEVKELTEKDKKRLESLYKMNDVSSIVVHPNKAAKNGKFHCQLMSLSSLLEYRSDDQKEHTFEISMFAEQFQEMLLRDASFNIYKALLKLPKQTELDKTETEPEAKRRREEAELTSPAKASAKIDSELLLSFCTFDSDHADYIKDHDLEDIIQAVGLDLSRSQVKRLIAKAVNRKGAVYYRDLSVDSDAVSIVSDLELSRGNRPRMLKSSEHSSIYLDDSASTDAKVSEIEAQILEMVARFEETKAEVSAARTVHHASKDLENSLRAELKELEARLYGDRKAVREMTQNQDAYGSLLRMARDVLERAKSKIDRQFEKEAERDMPKEEASTAVVADTLTPNGNQ